MNQPDRFPPDSNVTNLKVPPHSVEAEQAVIGAVFTKPDVLVDIDLKPEEFYRREHRAIWQAMLDLQEARKGIDLTTLLDELQDTRKLDDAGGLDYIGNIFGAIHSAHNALSYAGIVREKAIKRKLISAAHSIADKGYNSDDELHVIVNEAQRLMAELEVVGSGEAEAVGHTMHNVIQDMHRQAESTDEVMGVATGHADIDAHTEGLQHGDLIIVAGRPSQGKTSLAMNWAEHVANSGALVIIFSLEMPKEDLVKRLVAAIARVPLAKVRKPKTLTATEWDKVIAAQAKVKDLPFFIDDSAMTSTQLLSRVRRISLKYGKPALVVVDYLQLMTDPGEGEEKIGNISRNLKIAARELKCPVVALSQLNRSLEQRPDKRPLMSDLRGSGSIEQDADQIIMVYRDEVYHPQTQHKGTAEIIFRKFRNGELGTIYLTSNLWCSRFDNMAKNREMLPPPPPPSWNEDF